MKWPTVHSILPYAMEPTKDKSQAVTISIILLDHTEVEFQVSKRDRGQVLLDRVFDHVRCKEPKYYGLQFPQHVPDTMKWLDPGKSIRKQFRRGYPQLLYYRIKYFVFDISRLKDPLTRYQLFLQVKLEIAEHRLSCPPSIAPVLASYTVQSEMGDYDPVKHGNLYLRNFKFIPNQTPEFLSQVHKLHKRHRGLSPDQAELLFLQEAKRLKRYGVDIHHGRDLEGNEIEVGVATDGIGLFRNSEPRHKYEWAKIVKILFKRKQFFIQLQKEKSSEETPVIEFSMENYRACKRLWKNCVDCHSFYRKEKERLYRKHGGNAPTKGEKQVFGFFPIGGKNKSKCDKAEKDILRFKTPQKSASSRMLNSSVGAAKERELFTDQDAKEVRRLSAPPSVTLAVMPDSKTHPNSRNNHYLPMKFVGDNDLSREPSNNSEISDPLESYSDSAFLQPIPPPDTQNPLPEPYVLPGNILLVRLKPDQQGRYGFNIKGGNDQSMPITVSKIALGSAADVCTPTLSVGDEILQVNGRDASSLSHDQAVHFIRATSEFSGELVLLTKPHNTAAVYEEIEHPAEELKISENGTTPHPDADISLFSLESSMSGLQKLLDDKRVMATFDTIRRKNSAMTMKEAKLPANIPRNRYRDISPYDATRVKLTDWETDYINGNHIYMEISDTELRNHYIACQGPLQNTCGDFWAMVWEQKSTLIIMVTTTLERGMVKCFQYWPDDGCRLEFSDLVVTSKTETVKSCFVFREFEITRSGSEVVGGRNVSHIQYVAWPDHGVPDDSSDFLDFINCVRKKRAGSSVPTVVHCSAGIGRTGVMIAVETAMCLIEAKQPVSPHDIMKRMRDQRAMMIQTPLQFRFVCEAILHVYKACASESKSMGDKTD